MSRPIGLRPMPSPPLITPVSRLAQGNLRNGGHGVAASGVSPWSDAADCLLAFPFVIEVPTFIPKCFWVNGSAAGGNSDVAIYDEGYVRLTASGSTAGSGNSVPQVVAYAFPVTLVPGLYYAAMTHSATTTNQLTRWSVATTGIAVWQSAGCWKQASIAPGSTPNPAVPADITNVAFPVFGLIVRTAFDL